LSDSSCPAEVILTQRLSPELQGRVFSVSIPIKGAAASLGRLLARPLADVVFEPAMTAKGASSAHCGWGVWHRGGCRYGDVVYAISDRHAAHRVGRLSLSPASHCGEHIDP
ncbi:MAG: hypothetical protein QNJ46_34235, partial [Leptolyngbyaceae cyanobacterium MO_188.B28]|nr:hypothetical protein [Leptolyngbyaceae cyanobacterium MO_188.B28]